MIKRKISAKIIADSISPQGSRITSFILTYPRFIHAELMTHRMFSRNSASSRAIPFAKMVKMVQKDPFIPIAWQRDHKGMQGNEYFTDNENIDGCVNEWLKARDYAVQQATTLNEDLGYGGVTKQLCNRLLEPFMWYTVLVTSTEWDNFFELRTPKYKLTGLVGDPVKSRKDWLKKMQFSSALHPSQYPKTEEDWWTLSESSAEIHIQALAEAIWDVMNESTPKQLKAGEWHIPFEDNIDTQTIKDFSGLTNSEAKIKIATARCARLSYMTFDGEIDYEKDIKLHDHLLASHHMSPFEHVAKCMTELEYYSFIKGKYPTTEDEYGIVNYEGYPLLKKAMFEEEVIGENSNNGNKYGWCNNFRGFIQYRYLIENKQ